MSAVALVADIGGTNARFALTDVDAATPALREMQALKASEFASLEHAIEHYLASVGVAPKRGALAVASPGGHRRDPADQSRMVVQSLGVAAHAGLR